MRWADWLENLPKVVVLIHTPVIIDGNSAYFNSTRRRRRRLYININASIISFSLWPTPIHSSFLVSFCFQFSNDTILVPECRDFLDRLIYERETASLAPTHEKKGSLDLNVRLDVVDRCAYINYFTRCLKKRKEQKKQRKTKQFYPQMLFFNFCFLSLFHFSGPFFPPPPSIISKQFKGQQKSIMERTGIYFILSRVEGDMYNMKNDLVSMWKFPFFPMCSNGPSFSQ